MFKKGADFCRPGTPEGAGRDHAIHHVKLQMASDQLLEIHMEALCEPADIQRVQNDRFSHAFAAVRAAAALAAAGLYHIPGIIKATVPDFFNTYLSFHFYFLSLSCLWLTFWPPELILKSMLIQLFEGDLFYVI
ncbi:MAG: hypothetical protein ACLR6B_17725 [Blautia sp.]